MGVCHIWAQTEIKTSSAVFKTKVQHGFMHVSAGSLRRARPLRWLRAAPSAVSLLRSTGLYWKKICLWTWVITPRHSGDRALEDTCGFDTQGCRQVRANTLTVSTPRYISQCSFLLAVPTLRSKLWLVANAWCKTQCDTTYKKYFFRLLNEQ